MARKDHHKDAQKFKEDRRAENPGLHLLYTKGAIIHLTAIDEAIEKFQNFSNLNMDDITVAMRNERLKLVTQNAAYNEAQQMLFCQHIGRDVSPFEPFVHVHFIPDEEGKYYYYHSGKEVPEYYTEDTSVAED
jgi:hypothetical protein